MRNCSKIAVVGLTAVMMLQGCSLFSSEKDLNPMAPLPKVESLFSVKTNWSSSIGRGVGDFYSQLTPVVNDEQIFAAARSGVVMAFDRNSGKRLWRNDLASLPINEDKRSARLSGGLVAEYGMIFLASENGVVYALHQESGELLWHTPMLGEVVASPSVEDGTVVVVTSAGNIVALDSTNGDVLWRHSSDQPPLTLRSAGAPLITNGAVFYGRADGKVEVLLLSSGLPVRVSKIADPRGGTELARMVDVDAKPLVIGDEVFNLAYNGQLTARKLLTDNEIWARKYSGYRDMAAVGSTIIVTDSRSHLFAINSVNGEELWSNSQLENRTVTAPAIMDNFVLVGDIEGHLYWLDLLSGEIKAMQLIDRSGLYTAPIVRGDSVYVQSRNGKLYALTRP